MLNLSDIFAPSNQISNIEVNKESAKINHSLNVNVSVDCVVIGFDDKELNVLLIKRLQAGDEKAYSPYKLPGSPIYMDESLDDAAKRVLVDCTGLKYVSLEQFRAYGEIDRLRRAEDVQWLERTHGLASTPERIVSISYIAFVRQKKFRQLTETYQATWMPVSKLDDIDLAFDHRQIITDAIRKIRRDVEVQPSIVFEILPRKFTMLQLRAVYETIHGEKLDIRNFHKKMTNPKYIVQLDELEKDVPHRAAHLYKFDRVVYKRLRGSI